MNNFQITIQRKSGDSWPVVVEESTGGVSFPIRKEGVLRIEEAAALGQRTPKDYGTVLGKALFCDDVRDAFVQSLRGGGGCLRVLLFVEAPDLKTWRWERLCAPLDGPWDFLALNQRTPFSLYLPSLANRLFPPIGRRDLRALVLAASPEGIEPFGLESFDVPTVLKSVQTALGRIPCDVLAEVEGAVGPPTLDALCGRLTQGPYTLLHVICHGQLDPESKDTSLFLGSGDAKKTLALVSGTLLIERLRKLGATHGLPHLAFLATCESASSKPEAEGALGGLAQRLVRELGMQAVVAMTERVSVATAEALAEGFYPRVREHGEVDRALVEATAALAGRYDITVPALFSRLEGRPLFSDTLDREPNPKEQEFSLSRLGDLVKERAPVLWPEYETHAAKLRGTLGVDSAALSEPAKNERKKALEEVNKLCGEVLDLSFKALSLGTEPPAYDNRPPFRGLYPFRVKDREFFFGREKLVEDLRRKLAEHNFLALLGPSGCGKSSLVMAGLIPALQSRDPGLEMVYMTPGSDPSAQLEGCFPKLSLIGNQQSTVLVVDQFEELFTLCADGDKRRVFLDRLLTLIRDRRVVITMRADFWGDCASFKALKEAMMAHQELIAPMDSAELRRAMEGQAQKVGLRFEADLSNTILDDVQNEPGAMPLLQHALLELWKRRHGRWLLSSEYREKIGGVKQAIARTADEIYEHSPKEDRERMRNIFIRLTRLGDETGSEQEQRDTRRRCAMWELVSEGDSLEAVRKLVHHLGSENARLVVIKPGGKLEEAEVEVAHEALIRHWPRLRQWLNEDRVNYRLRDSISEDAKEYMNSEKADNLLPRWNSKLEAAIEISRKPGFFTKMEKDYLDACIELREKEKLEREQQENNLRSALAEAQRQGRIATARQLAAQSQATPENYPQRRLLFAAEALATTIRADEPRVPIAEEVLRQALDRTGGRGLSGHESLILAVAISADKHWLVTGSRDKTARLWDLSSEDPASSAIVLRGHEGPIFAVAISADNRWLVTGSWDKTARLWDLSSEDPASSAIVLRGHEGPIFAVAISADNRWLVTGSRDKTARLWELSSKEPASSVTVLRGHEDYVSAVAISADNRWLVTGSQDKTARLWELSSKEPASSVIVLRGHEGTIFAVAISADNHWLVTGSEDKTARLWDLSSPEPASSAIVLRGHEGPVFAVAISADKHWLVTGSRDKTARLWDLCSKEPASSDIVLCGHERTIHAVAISADNRWLVTGSGDKTARLWDLSSKEPASSAIVLRGHEGAISAVAISADNRWLVTGSEDKTARLWDLSSKEPASSAIVLRGHEDHIFAVAIGADNRWLVTGSRDKTARLWELSSKKPASSVIVLRGHKDYISVVAISADSRWLVTGSRDKTARLWELSSKEPASSVIVLRGHEDYISAVAISADNRWLVTGSRDKTARLWELSSKEPASSVIVLRGHEGWISAVAISADNRWLVTGSRDKTARLWELSSKEPASSVIVLRGHEDYISAVAISADSRWLVTGSEDKTARLWDLSSPEPASSAIVLRGHEGLIFAVAISADNRWLVTGSRDKTARLWDLSSPEPASSAIVLRGHEGPIFAVAISADTRWLVTGSWDKTARLWDLSSEDPASSAIVLRGHEDYISAVAISADTRWLVTGSWDKTARLWDLRLDELLNLACRTAGRNLTKEEWAQYMGNLPYQKTCPDF